MILESCYYISGMVHIFSFPSFIIFFRNQSKLYSVIGIITNYHTDTFAFSIVVLPYLKCSRALKNNGITGSIGTKWVKRYFPRDYII